MSSRSAGHPLTWSSPTCCPGRKGGCVPSGTQGQRAALQQPAPLLHGCVPWPAVPQLQSKGEVSAGSGRPAAAAQPAVAAAALSQARRPRGRTEAEITESTHQPAFLTGCPAAQTAVPASAPSVHQAVPAASTRVSALKAFRCSLGTVERSADPPSGPPPAARTLCRPLAAAHPAALPSSRDARNNLLGAWSPA